MQEQKRKFVLVGQGIAGSLLSMIMRDRGIPHRVIDLPHYSQSSRIAAGVANPIVLKRLKWVKDAETFWPSMRRFYERWDSKLAPSNGNWRSLAMLHRFKDPGEVNLWDERSEVEPFRSFLGEIRDNADPLFDAPHGWGSLQGLYWLKTSSFLDSYREKLLDWGILERAAFPIPAGGAHIWPPGLEEGEELVFCNGHLARETFEELRACFAPTRGEVITVRAPKLPEDQAYHAGVFAIPLGEHLFKIGASYGHDRLEDLPTEEGRAWLEEQWQKMYQGPYELVEHQAGVRPTVRDRKPLLGTLRPGIHLFNGLGSRGVMMAPYLGEHLLDHLWEGKPLAAHWNWRRFI